MANTYFKEGRDRANKSNKGNIIYYVDRKWKQEDQIRGGGGCNRK